MEHICNNTCPFFQLLHDENEGTGLSRINFKCTDLNIEASVKLKTFNEGYTLYDCPLEEQDILDEDEDEF